MLFAVLFFLFNNRIAHTRFFAFWLFFFAVLRAEVFEQSMFFYHTPNHSVSERRDTFSMTLNLRASSLFAHESFDIDGNTVPLFGRYGDLDFNLFANNLVGNTINGPSIYDTYPETKQFQNDINNLFGAYENKQVYCSGKLHSFELAFVLKLALPSQPFYALLDLPLRFINVKKMEFVNIANQHSDFTRFLNERITSVLNEHNFEPLSDDYDIRGISDLVFRLGWCGQERFSHGLVRFVWADVSMGISLPFSTMTQSNKNFMFHIPLGYGGVLGAILKYEAGIEFNQRMALLLFGENWFFLKKTIFLHLLHNENMGCFNFFKESEVTTSRGPYWSLGAVVKTRLMFEGIYALFGYSYHSQEESSFDNTSEPTGESNVLLDMAKRNEFLALNPGLQPSIERYDRENRYFYPINNALMNKDPRLRRSYAHIIHLSLLVQPDRAIDWCDGARISLSYHHPIFGKSAFAGVGVSGQIGIGLNIDF